MSDQQVRREHPLVDTTEPNLLEATFDYNLPPKICFDGPLVAVSYTHLTLPTKRIV